VDVLSRKLSKERWNKVKPVVGALLSQSTFVITYFSWRPISPDPGDEHVIDSAMNAGAVVITSNIRHYKLAEATLGLKLMKPVEFVDHLITILKLE